MTREDLESKSLSDLSQIAVAFGDFTAEEVLTKTKEELIAAITRGEVSVAPKKAKAASTKGKSVKKTESVKKEEASEVKADEPVKEAPTEKKKRASTKKTATSESDSDKKEEKPVKVSKTTKTTKATKSSKTSKPNVVAVETKSDEVTKLETSEEVKTEESPKAKTSRKTNSGTRKTSKSKKVSEEVATIEESSKESSKEPEVKVSEEEKKETPSKGRKPSTRKRGKNASKDEPSDKDEEKIEPSSDVKADEASNPSEDEKKPENEQKKKEQPERLNRNGRRNKALKRTISFGPDKEAEVISESEVTENTENNQHPQEEVKVEPEIEYIEIEGILSIGTSDKGDFNGFIHTTNYLPGENDAYVPGQMIRKLGLRRGDKIKGLCIQPRGKERYMPLKRVVSVNGVEINEDSDFDVLKKRPKFESLTAVYPDEKLKLETKFNGSQINDISTRIIDLFCPIGKGQRGMIVSPPKAGKTVLLKKVANAITANNPNCKLIVLLIDERPEEVTDMQRSIEGEVVFSTFDKRPENHVRVTELVLERAMRLVEIGEDVVILLDSMTRLARAYNLTINPTGRTLSGGLDPGSLYGPKRFFGAARNIENGGSLTIIATALIETGSRMDEVIFEEFKGTGNMEIVLDRKLADRRVFPAIAVDKSGTRREDLLLTPEELDAIWLFRKKIADIDTIAATEGAINLMQRTTCNASFVLSIKKSLVDG